MPALFLATESISAHLEFFRNLRYQGTGMLVVIVSLGLLALIVSFVAKILEPRPASASPQLTQPAGEEIPPEVQAVIAAAVLTVLRSSHRIHHIRPPADPHLTAWSAEGRRQIFLSHSIRR